MNSITSLMNILSAYHILMKNKSKDLNTLKDSQHSTTNLKLLKLKIDFINNVYLDKYTYILIHAYIYMSTYINKLINK